METEPEQEPLASSPPAKSAAYILKVVASQMSPESPDGVEKTTELVSGSEEVLFDSSAGDSDSYSDAHRKFVEAWWALSSSPEKKETTVLQLFVNGALKEEQSWKKIQEEKAAKGKKGGKGKKSAPSKKAEAKAPAAKKKSAKEVAAPAVAVADKMETDEAPAAEAKDSAPATPAASAAPLAAVNQEAVEDSPMADATPVAPAAADAGEVATPAPAAEAETAPTAQGVEAAAALEDSSKPSTKKPAAKKEKKPVLLDSEGKEIKKNQSAYFLFVAEKREAVTAELKATNASGEAVGEAAGEAAVKVSGAVVAKRIGEMWKAMSNEEKTPYATAAEADKVRYDTAVASNPENAKVLAEQVASKGEKRKLAAAKKTETAALAPTTTAEEQTTNANSEEPAASTTAEEVAPPKAKKSKKRALVDADGNEIKGALTSFFLFSNEKRAEVKAELEKELQELIDEEKQVTEDVITTEGMKITPIDVSKKLSSLWAALSEEEKATYEAAAVADKQRFDEAVASNTSNVWYLEEMSKKSAEKAEKKAEKEKLKEERAKKAAEKKKAAEEKAALEAAKKAAEARKQPSIFAAFGIKPKKKPQPATPVAQPEAKEEAMEEA